MPKLLDLAFFVVMMLAIIAVTAKSMLVGTVILLGVLVCQLQEDFRHEEDMQ